jgi:hypothetical protein
MKQKALRLGRQPSSGEGEMSISAASQSLASSDLAKLGPPEAFEIIDDMM